MRSKGIVREHKIVNARMFVPWAVGDSSRSRGTSMSHGSEKNTKGTQLDTHQIALNRDEAWGGSQRLPVFFLHTPPVL